MKKNKPIAKPSKKPSAKKAVKPKKAAAKPAAKTTKAKKPAAAKTPAKAKAKATKPLKKPATPAKAKSTAKTGAAKTSAAAAKKAAASTKPAKAPKPAPAPKEPAKGRKEKTEQPKASKPEKTPKASKASAKTDMKPQMATVEAQTDIESGFKRPAKPFFTEVKPGMERVIKRGDKSAASPVIDLQARRKGPATEESAEELAERIERELQSQSFLRRNRMRPQMCTKCGINAVSSRFTIDRELAYCEICAEILHLGETKEARRMEISLAPKSDDDEGGDTNGNGDDEAIPEDVD